MCSISAVSLVARADAPVPPTHVAAGGDAEHPAHDAIDKRPGVRYESEPLDGTAFVSRANQAAAFERISRSSLSCCSLAQRRKFMRSYASGRRCGGLVAIGLRDPVADRLRQARTLSPVLPASGRRGTSSIICRRNSGGYGGRFLDIAKFLKHKCFGVHESGGTSLSVRMHRATRTVRAGRESQSGPLCLVRSTSRIERRASLGCNCGGFATIRAGHCLRLKVGLQTQDHMLAVSSSG